MEHRSPLFVLCAVTSKGVTTAHYPQIFFTMATARSSNDPLLMLPNKVRILCLDPQSMSRAPFRPGTIVRRALRCAMLDSGSGHAQLEKPLGTENCVTLVFRVVNKQQKKTYLMFRRKLYS